MNGTTILEITPRTNLTPSELERFAYMQGQSLLACYAASADDLEGQVDGFDALIDAAKKEAFEEGRRVGMALDTAEIIEDLERKVADLHTSHQRCCNHLQVVCDWLRGEDSKTVKSRQAFEQRLRAALFATPRH